MPDADGLMRRALELARRGIPAASPNPAVGCVLERDGVIVGEGAHLVFGGPHAEANALAAAGERARGATAWVTLEPCAHSGPAKKTPPCAEALIAAGVRRVVWACADPNPLTSGRARERFHQAGIETQEGVLEHPAKRLNAPFFKSQLKGLPWVIAKWAMTLDGKIATSSGLSKWITGEEARSRARELRAEAGCVLVGIGTVLADDPSLAGAPGRPTPRRAVADASGRLPGTSQLAMTAATVETFVGVAEGAPPANIGRLEGYGCRVVRLPETEAGIDLAAFLREIGKTSTCVFAEGGSGILGSLFDARLVDEVAAFIAPSVLGGSLAPAPVGGKGRPGPALAERLIEVRTEVIGEDVLVRGLLKGGFAGSL